jgi:thiol-disulfide isomerase/thioredoxin
LHILNKVSCGALNSISGGSTTVHSVKDSSEQFFGKVVIVTAGRSWCPNCHDDAPFLMELYRKHHQRGLEIVDLSSHRQWTLGGDQDRGTVAGRRHVTTFNISPSAN